MSDEVPSARPVPVPTPVESPPLEAAVSPVAEAASPPPDWTYQQARVALERAETALAQVHGDPGVQQGTANPERVASALTLVNQARQRFEEWLAQF